MTDIPLVMERFNPWWKGEGPKLPAPDISRDLLPTLMAGILKKPVQLVTGLRQVGKTTLQKQMILKLLKTIPPECILYYSFDLHGGEDSRGVVQELLETYLSSKLRTPLTELEEPVYIFLDEVHRLPGWSQEVKYYADLQPALRFVVTGSSSMNLSRGAGESLVGRASVHELSPFSFREFLAFQGFELPERCSLRKLMEAEELKAPSFTNQERLRIECTRYQEMGGLPGLYQIEGELERKREMKARVDLTLFRDLLEVFEIRQPGRLSALFSFLVSNASQVVNYSTITNALTLKYETLKNYLDYLELSHLIFQVDQYTPNPLKTISRNPKIYLADHAFFQLWDCDEGLMVENLCFVHLQQLAKQHWTTTLNYWVGKGREEVDMVIPTDKGPLPVEIKFRQTITKSQLKGLRNFSKEFDTQRALLITLKDEGPLELETGAGTLCVLKLPLWKFLLLD